MKNKTKLELEILDNRLQELFEQNKLSIGRLVSAHKVSPDGCKCIWNANIVVESLGKVWYGDLNLTKEGDRLKKIAEEIGEPLYVLYEGDCRFGTENDPIALLISRAVWSTKDGIIGCDDI